MPNKSKGAHQERRLTAAFVRTVKEPGFYGDGHGLALKVDASGAKRWVQRIVINGKRRDIGLGSANLVSLAEARETALQQRKTARAGEDPLAAKRRSQALITFEQAARECHTLNGPTWRNEKHAKQWLSTLETFVFPHFGSKRIDRIDSSDVMLALAPVWNTRPETARRVKQRIGTVLKWSMAQGLRTDNPADTVSKALPKHDRSKIARRLALPYADVARAINTVRGSEASASTKLAFEFLVLTAARSGEVREARWSEIDLDKALWSVPASRMKAKREHRVPLSESAVAILKQARELPLANGGFVFPSATGKALSDATLSKLLRELGVAAVPHGFRSSFRDWAGETTNHPHQAIEFALAHVISNKAEAAYARSDLLERRRELMADWSRYLIETKA